MARINFAEVLIGDARWPVAGLVEMTTSLRPNFSRFARYGLRNGLMRP